MTGTRAEPESEQVWRHMRVAKYTALLHFVLAPLPPPLLFYFSAAPTPPLRSTRPLARSLALQRSTHRYTSAYFSARSLARSPFARPLSA